MYEKKPWLKFYGSDPAHPLLPEGDALRGPAPRGPRAARDARADVHGSTDQPRRAGRPHRPDKPRAGCRGHEEGRPRPCLPAEHPAVSHRVLRVEPSWRRAGDDPSPLGAGGIRGYARQTSCTWAVTLDAFYPRFAEVRGQTDLARMVICGASDCMGPLMTLGFAVTEARKIPPVPADPGIIRWKELERRAERPRARGARPAVPRRPFPVPLQRGHDGRLQGHHALQPQLQRARHPDQCGGRPDPPRGLHALDPAHVPRLRARRGNPRHPDTGRDVHPRAPLHPGRPGRAGAQSTSPAYMAGVPTLFDALAANRSSGRPPWAASRACSAAGTASAGRQRTGSKRCCGRTAAARRCGKATGSPSR